MSLSRKSIQHSVMNSCAAALRFYTHAVPFSRGRGVFIRTIDFLKARGWPAPPTHIGMGLSMEFEPSFVGWKIFERGEWEPAQTSLFLALVEAGMTVVNVGAYTGYYTLLAARKVGPTGHVYAFEMQPAICAMLRRNIVMNQLSPRVTVVEAACFSSSGEATIESGDDPAQARLALRANGANAVTHMLSLDDFAASVGLRKVDVILIDAEGADFEILKGAANILARHAPSVIAEVNYLEAFGGSEAELKLFMEQFGYDCIALREEFSRNVHFVPQRRANQYAA